MGRIVGASGTPSIATAASQLKYEVLTGFAVKIRIKGSMLTANTGYGPWVRLFELTKNGMYMFVTNNGDDGTNHTKSVYMYDPSNGYVRADFTWSDPTADVVIYYHFDHGNGYILEVYDPATGTQLGNMVPYTSFLSDLETGSGKGAVNVGDGSTTWAATDIDGVAIYSSARSGAARYNAPSASDAGIVGLYTFDETSGTTSADAIAGGTALTLTGFTFTTGSTGGWDLVAPTIHLSTSSASASTTAGGSTPTDSTVMITNTSDGSLSVLSTSIDYTDGEDWLSASLSATSEPSTLTLSYDVTGLAAGAYHATVHIASSAGGVTNSPQDVAVTLTITAVATGSRVFGVDRRRRIAASRSIAAGRCN